MKTENERTDFSRLSSRFDALLCSLLSNFRTMLSQALLALSTLFLTFFFTFENLMFGFYLFIAVIPLLHKETFSLVIWDLLPIRLVLAAVGLVSIGRFITWYKKNGRSAVNSELGTFLKDPVLILLLSLLTVRVLSLINTLNLVASLKLLTFFGGILFFYIFSKYLAQKNGWSFMQTATKLYVFVAFVTGILAILQFVVQMVWGVTLGGLWVVPGHWPRTGSTFWDVNHYGGYLVTVLPLALSLAFASKKTSWTKFWGLVAVFLAVVLLLTQSRSAWLGVGASLAVFMAIMWWWGLKKQVYIILVTLLIAFIAFINSIYARQVTLSDYIGGFMHTRIDSSDTHFDLLQASGELLLKYPWIGAGYGGFSERLIETSVAPSFFSKDNRLGETRVPPHSVWGEVVGETGIPGTVLYSLLILIILGYSLVATLKTVDNEKRFLQLGFLGGVLGIVFSGIFYSYNVEFYWWTLLGAYLLALTLVPELNNFSYFTKLVTRAKFLPLIVLVTTFTLLAFVGLNQTHVIDWDEAIYAQVARNIAETGQWLTLQWYKGAPWFEKPPLYMWLTAPLISLWGNISLAARFWSAIAGIGGVIATYLIGQKLFNRLTGFLAATTLLSAVHYLYYSRNGMLDVSVTLFITLTIYFFIRARESGRKLDWAMVGVTAGLGVMTKDIIGLLGLGVIITFSLLDYLRLKNKKPYQVKKNCYLLFAICFLLIALPWHLIMTLKWGAAFWDVYFVGHVFGRAFTDAQGKTQPLLWYLTVIKVGYRIWALPALGGLFLIIAKIAKKDWRYLLLGLWLIVIFTFFSISRSKLIWYLIPIYPALAVIAGRFLERFSHALVVMYSALISPQTLRVTFAALIFIVSLSYIYLMRERVYYPDFNLHIYELFKAKDEKLGVDKTVYYVGLADPAVMYISRGPVSSVTRGNVEEIGGRRDPAVFIMPQDIYKILKKDGFNFNEVVEWGGYSLVDKPRTP